MMVYKKLWAPREQKAKDKDKFLGVRKRQLIRASSGSLLNYARKQNQTGLTTRNTLI